MRLRSAWHILVMKRPVSCNPAVHGARLRPLAVGRELLEEADNSSRGFLNISSNNDDTAMRKITPLLITLLVALAGCTAMRGPAGPASQIIMDTPYTAGEAFNRVGRELSRRGYNFEEINRTFGAIRTDPRRINPTVRVQIAVDVMDTDPARLRFWGWYRTEEGTSRIVQTSEEGTPAYSAWQELYEVARAMPGSIDLRY